jgi:hypothetical protein
VVDRRLFCPVSSGLGSCLVIPQVPAFLSMTMSRGLRDEGEEETVIDHLSFFTLVTLSTCYFLLFEERRRTRNCRYNRVGTVNSDDTSPRFETPRQPSPPLSRLSLSQ